MTIASEYESAVAVLVYEKEPSVYVEEKTSYTFDDIEKWDEIYFRGDMWWVSDKGEDISDQDGSHVELWSETRNKLYIIHEEWVDRFLNTRKEFAPITGKYATKTT